MVLIFPPLAPKFIRRNDLSLAIRTSIVFQSYHAQINKERGVITDLSRQYKVSREFIYKTLSLVKDEIAKLLSSPKKPEKASKKSSEVTILAQRFERKCSVDGISTLMKRDNRAYSSVGSVSQILTHLGHSLPNTVKNSHEAKQLVAFTSDEIFAKSSPLLITVEPVSSVILRIELAEQRTGDVWSKHFQSIEENGFQAQLFVSDAGTGLITAHKETLTDVPWQLDTFHGIAHRLGDWVRRLEKSAYTAIEDSEKQENKLASAKSESIIDKRLNLCLNADKTEEQAIDLYDNFHFLYKILIHQLNTFDSNGELRPCTQAKEIMEIALELIETLQHDRINKEVVSIKKTLPSLLTYFDDAIRVVKHCQTFTDDPTLLQSLFLAWQWNKSVIKSKVPSRKNKAIEERQFYLELAELLVGDKEKYPLLKDAIFTECDEIIQASSMVECINSILRPYLNQSKNQITQEFLNTFMFYHNNRRYHKGKRKGKTPMEILTGVEQKEDWITLLLKEVREKEASLIA